MAAHLLAEGISASLTAEPFLFVGVERTSRSPVSGTGSRRGHARASTEPF